MPLSFESQIIDKVAVIRCKGRITLGPEVQALEEEIERQIKVPGANILRVNRVVLQLAETEFIDSSGLGVLVRLYSVLGAAGGGLKLCAISERVLKVFKMTNLLTVFPAYASEAEAIRAFSAPPRSPQAEPDASKIRIVCIDTSKDVLAGLSALLTRSGYEVLTTRYIGEAVTLVKTTRPRVVICGPGMMKSPLAQEVIGNFQQLDEKPEVVTLPSDFYTAEAGQAGEELLTRLQSLTAV